MEINLGAYKRSDQVIQLLKTGIRDLTATAISDFNQSLLCVPLGGWFFKADTYSPVSRIT